MTPSTVKFLEGHAFAQRRYRVDQALINRYAAVSGDHNPLHTDPAFAKTTQFGRTIAHGMMTLAFISDSMYQWCGSAWLASSDLSITFIAPVFADDEVTVCGEVASVTTEGGAVFKILCKAGPAERLVVTGEAKLFDHPQ